MPERPCPQAIPRRRALQLLSLALPGGCALAPPADRAPQRLLDLRSGREITVDDLLEQLRASRYVLLGEQHDNPQHHARRAELLRRLAGSGAVVVAEHLNRGRRVSPDGDLLAALQAAGFDAEGWQWPLHEPLFSAARAADLPLLGGNLPAGEARRIAREGLAALPADLALLLNASPLPPLALSRLDADLLAGHCGLLPSARLPAMRLAQRARDAAMALALRDAARASTGPAILLAGNAHVRADYGVPRLLEPLEPTAATLSVVFGEPGSQADRGASTHLWITGAPDRDDPCTALAPRRQPAAPTHVPEL